MIHNKIGIFSAMGVLSLGIAVLGLGLVFFLGGESRGVVLGETALEYATSSIADTESPSKPSGLKAEMHDGKILLSWEPSSDNVGVSGYALYRNGSFMVTLTGTSFTDTSVKAGSSYKYAVLAVDFSGNKSDFSSTVSSTIPTMSLSTTTAPTTTTAPVTSLSTTIPPTSSTSSPSVTSADTTAPSRPSHISVTILDNRTVRIEWSVVSDAAGYRLFRNNVVLTSKTGTIYTDRSVYGGQEYRYSVVAFDTAGNTSQRSDEKAVMMPLVTVQTGSTTTTTTWTAENDGKNLVVKNATGEVVQGQAIAPPETVEMANPLTTDTKKVSAAQAAIQSAIQSGFLPARSTVPNTSDISTPDTIVRAPESQNLDFDNDGLSNIDELRLGTDPYNPDTDRDGFSDGDEVKSRHDPLHFSPGDDRDKIVMEDIKAVLSKKKAVEQESPKTVQDIKKDTRYQVKNVEIIKASKPDAKDTVRLSGTALPNSMVTLYIYSSPTIVTVKTDSLGNWSYDVNQNLEDGVHEAFVAVTDTTGKVTSYGEGVGFVKTADAITVRPIAEAAQTVSGNQSPLERSQTEYFFAAFIAILFFSGAALIVVSRKNTTA